MRDIFLYPWKNKTDLLLKRLLSVFVRLYLFVFRVDQHIFFVLNSSSLSFFLGGRGVGKLSHVSILQFAYWSLRRMAQHFLVFLTALYIFFGEVRSELQTDVCLFSFERS